MPRERFAALAAREDTEIDLAEAALWIAAEEYEALDVSRYLARLDELAAAPELAGAADADPVRQIEQLNQFLFVTHGFAGNRQEYNDPRNSFLNEVLDRKAGIPITLAVVYMEVGRRAGLPIEGVGFPGHFLAKHAGGEEILVDPFHGRVVTRAECQQRLRAAAGRDVVLDPAVHLRAAMPREILVRMLTNLKHIGLGSEDFERAFGCSDRILLLVPDTPEELRDHALIAERLQYDAVALDDFRRLREVSPSAAMNPALDQKIAALEAKVGAYH